MQNNEQFPSNLIKANFDENDNGFFYEMENHWRANYLQHPSIYNEGNMINPENFKNLFTIFTFDVSKQEFALAGSSISCNLHILRLKQNNIFILFCLVFR